MTKKEFLDRLGTLLACLPADKIADAQAFYAEMIEDRMEDGLTEQEAVAAMGTPGDAAEGILDDLPAVPRTVAKTRRKSRALLWTLAILGSPIWLTLALAFVIVALVGYAVIWALALCIWIVALACFAAAPLALLLAVWGAWTGNVPYLLVSLGEVPLMLGLGLLCLRGALGASRQIVRLSRAWGRKMASPFKKDPGDKNGGAGSLPHGRGAHAAAFRNVDQRGAEAGQTIPFNAGSGEAAVALAGTRR